MTIMHGDDVGAYVDIVRRTKRSKGLAEPHMYTIYQLFGGTTAETGAYVGAIVHITDRPTNRRLLVHVAENSLDMKIHDAGAAVLNAEQAGAFNRGETDTPYIQTMAEILRNVIVERGAVCARVYDVDRKNGGFVFQRSVNYGKT